MQIPRACAGCGGAHLCRVAGRYGPNVASLATQLVLVQGASQPAHQSGASFELPVLAELRDFYGARVRLHAPMVVRATSGGGSTSTVGQTQADVVAGHALFGSLGALGDIGTTSSMHFAEPTRATAGPNAGASALVASASVAFRGCIRGEVQVSAQLCQACEPGRYSFDPSDSACKPCPANAVCAGGADLVPRNGFWRMGPNTAGVLDEVTNECVGFLACVCVCVCARARVCVCVSVSVSVWGHA